MLAVLIASMSVLMIITIGIAYLVISSKDKECKGGKVLKNKKCVCPDEFSWNSSLSKCTEANLIYEKVKDFKSDYSKLHGPFSMPSNMRIEFDVKAHKVVGHNTFLLFSNTEENPTNLDSEFPLILFDLKMRLIVSMDEKNGSRVILMDHNISPIEKWISVIINIDKSNIIMKVDNNPEIKADRSLTTNYPVGKYYLYNGVKYMSDKPTTSDVTLRNLKITNTEVA